MTEQEAHNKLHQVLPPGSRVMISRNSWSWSTVGSGPEVHASTGDWHITVTVPDGVDQVEAAFAGSLEAAVAQVLAQIETSPAKPPRLAAGSDLIDEARDRQEAS